MPKDGYEWFLWIVLGVPAICAVCVMLAGMSAMLYMEEGWITIPTGLVSVFIAVAIMMNLGEPKATAKELTWGWIGATCLFACAILVGFAIVYLVHLSGVLQ